MSSAVERALAAGEGKLAANGALVCMTGDRTGRSPNEKFLEDVPESHAKIWWGKVNQPLPPASFDAALRLAVEHMNSLGRTYVFDGYAGADPKYRLGVRVVAEQAWHALFASTLFIRQGSAAAGGGPMHTVSSASRTCIASVSAVECTATVRMPIS